MSDVDDDVSATQATQSLTPKKRRWNVIDDSDSNDSVSDADTDPSPPPTTRVGNRLFKGGPPTRTAPDHDPGVGQESGARTVSSTW